MRYGETINGLYFCNIFTTLKTNPEQSSGSYKLIQQNLTKQNGNTPFL